MAGRLAGKVALITGAAGGIGRATARRFCEEGARVLVVDRVRAPLEELVAELREADAEVECFEADVACEEDCQAMVRRCEERFGGLHVLFNNAGIFPDEDGSVTDTSSEVLDRVLAVNVKGVFFGCKHGIPALLRSGGGSIINTASFVALMGAATSQSAYTASKGAVLSLTREIAVEYARKGIRANALCPGPVNTPLLQSLLADPGRRARRLVHIPMGRLAEAEEVAHAVVFLASDESSYVTGTAFLVDGGITAAYVTPE
jgi:NAD(P)-dependent dehydrogenase (short-subunit alcohol dehydrogenase family)